MTKAQMAELVDALVSGTSELNTRGGSSPLVRTKQNGSATLGLFVWSGDGDSEPPEEALATENKRFAERGCAQELVRARHSGGT